MQKFATVAVSQSRNNEDWLVVDDSMSFCLHDTEATARKRIDDSLKSGDRMVALLKIEGIFKIKSLEIEQVAAKQPER
jgi:hypothetical protein